MSAPRGERRAFHEYRASTAAGRGRRELEVKARSETTVCSSKWERLRVLLGDSLVEPERAKTRELSERLYPELLAA